MSLFSYAGGVLFSPKNYQRTLWKVLAWITLCLAFNDLSYAQKLTNNGQIINSGTIRLKNNAVGLPSAIDGTFELFGTNQIISSNSFKNLLLSGDGTITSTAGNVAVTGNLTIGAPVTLNITPGSMVTLGDTLFESGILNGAIQKSVNLTGSTTSSNFGNIGATISWTSNAPGITNVIRVSDSIHTGNGYESIKRYYAIGSAASMAVGNITLKFSDSELNGHDPRLLQLWRSLDNGQSWYYQSGTVDTVLRTMTASDVALSGRWTMADTLHPLGSYSAPRIPTIMTLASADSIKAQILTQVGEIAVVIRDAQANPVGNVAVTFNIISKPDSATGEMLSVYTDTTDASGSASTLLTLGNKVGDYVVAIKAAMLDTLKFIATAKHGTAAMVESVPFPIQSDTILQPVGPFTVVVRDIGRNPVDSALVTFSIVSKPADADSEKLSAQNVLTDPLGRASTVLTLGNKVGVYTVNAAVNGLSGSPIAFTAEAEPGTPVNYAGGGEVTAVNGSTIPITIGLEDIGRNPVPDEIINFSVASNDSLGVQFSNSTVPTNAAGQATTLLTLGNKTGSCLIQARSEKIAGSPLTIRINSIPGSAKSIDIVRGDNQSAPISTAIANNLVVTVLDSAGNAVPSIGVTFAITSIPDSSATGQTVTPAATLTDANGIATTSVTVGNKVGTYEVTASINTVPNAKALTIGGKKNHIHQVTESNSTEVKFYVTATQGAAASVTYASESSQTSQIGTQLQDPFAVVVHDVGMNPVTGTPVIFSISAPSNAEWQSLSEDTVVTSLGIAQTRLTLGSKTGEYKVSAVVGGLPDTLWFIANATHGAAALFTNLVGQNQIKPTGAPLDTAFALAVHDIGGNPVPDIPVRFTVVSAPAMAMEYSVSDTVMRTDSSGNAYTYLQLGDREGTYVVEASTQGVPQAQFAASGYYIYGDVNRDFFVNIADITTIIDFFNKNHALSATDSLKADFNRDGTIERSDLDSIRENILSRGIPAATMLASREQGKSPLIHTRRTDNVENTKAFNLASTMLETTPLGLRVNLQNAVPVRGLELRIKLNDSTANVNSVNLTTHRGKGLDVFVRTVNDEVRVLAYNLSNAEISPDTGSLFRLPNIYGLGAIDTSQAILALQSNTAAVSNVFVEDAVGKYPTAFSLGQNYPNPFNSSTTIEYDIPDDLKGSKIILQVFNILGQRIKTLVSGEQDPGHYKIRWDGTNDAGISVASGVYFYRFLTKAHGGSRKMILLK